MYTLLFALVQATYNACNLALSLFFLILNISFSNTITSVKVLPCGNFLAEVIIASPRLL